MARLLAEEAQQLTERAKSMLTVNRSPSHTPCTHTLHNYTRSSRSYSILGKANQTPASQSTLFAKHAGQHTQWYVVPSAGGAHDTHPNIPTPVHTANKRVEEDEMWDRRELQRARESSAARKRSRSPSAASPSSPCTRSSTDASPSPARHTDQDALRNSNQCGAGDAAHGEMQENDVQAWLAQRRVRGRGGVGSLVDEAAEEASPVPSPQQKKHKYRKKKKHKKHKKKKKKMKADHTSDSSD